MTSPTVMSDFGTKLRLLRGDVSQVTFADRLGITRAMVANYETGRSQPNAAQASRLMLLAAGGKDIAEELRTQTIDVDEFDSDLRMMFEKHSARSFGELADKLGISRSAVGNWVNRRRIPERYLLAKPQRPALPWQVMASLSILRDDALTDTQSRKTALTFLQQLEGSHA